MGAITVTHGAGSVQSYGSLLIWIVKGDNMKKYEVLSETTDGRLVAVASTEASDAKQAARRTAHFCDMMDIAVHSIRETPEVSPKGYMPLSMTRDL